MMTTRRSFIGGLLALSTGAATAGGSFEPTPSGVGMDVKKLCDWYGTTTVLTQLQALLDEGAEVTFHALRTRCNRVRNRRQRQEGAARRREAHAGTQIVFRGSVRLHESVYMAGRHVASRVNRHAVLAGVVPHPWRISGGVTEVAISRGAKLVVDARHDLHDLAMAEYAVTADGTYRLHVWGRPAWDGDDCHAPLLMRDLPCDRRPESPYEAAYDGLEDVLA